MAGPWTGDVQFTVLDGQAGVAAVPSQTVQAIVGCAIAGTDYQVVPTAQLSTLRSTFTGGPLPECAGLVIQAGGVVLAVKVPSGTAGVITGSAQATTAITGVTIVGGFADVVYTAQTPHVLATGDVVTIAGVVGATEVNGTWKITVIDATHFTVPVTSITAYVSGGTVQYTGSVAKSNATAAGTASPYFTGTPTDTIYPMVVAQTGFTIGTTGGSILISLDAGRTFGPPIAVGTATTIALLDVGGLDTGITLHLGVATKTWIGGGIVNGLPVGDYVRCSTVEPLPSDSTIALGLAALVTYLSGSEAVFPLIQVTGIWTSADATAFESGGGTNLDSMKAQYLFERMLMPTRDALAPIAWGGAGETETTWLASLNAAFSATTANRVCACAGYYNMPTAFPTNFASSPIYRRPFSFALGARQVSIQPQTHAGRASGAFGGNLSQIVRDPVRDPGDGFIYHDEYLTPSLDYYLPGGVGRFATARTRPRKRGFFAADPLTLASNGSDFSLLPKAIVMDVACTVVHGAMSNFSDADLTTKPNGTLSDSAAKTIFGACYDALVSAMKSQAMISDFSIVVDQTQNIQITQTLVVYVDLLGVIYVLQSNVTIGFVNRLPA